jgi:TolA-binding protein
LPPLSYEIKGGRVLDGGYLSETNRVGMALRFNEGTTLEFAPGARGRLRSITRQDARIAVDSGAASLRITPNPARHWAIEAGPFVVSVKGTVFDVSWEPSLERFELGLREGRVTVEGPISGGQLTLEKGQHLVVDLARAETVITESPSARLAGDMAQNPDGATTPSTPAVSSATLPTVGAGLPPTNGASPSATPPPTHEDSSEDSAAQGTTTRSLTQPSATPSETTGAPSPNGLASKAKAPATRSWAQELANGNWDRILSEVSREGVAVALDRASSEDLFALADAARYRHRFDLARDALLTQRRRFPNSARALDALFLLGRVEEPRSATGALNWYDEYLKRAPTGGYAAEALGRKMVILNQTSSKAQARAIAETYLSRFPQGSYAGVARAILHVR